MGLATNFGSLRAGGDENGNVPGLIDDSHISDDENLHRRVDLATLPDAPPAVPPALPPPPPPVPAPPVGTPVLQVPEGIAKADQKHHIEWFKSGEKFNLELETCRRI